MKRGRAWAHAGDCSAGGCRYGELPGTMQEDSRDGLTWQVFHEQCQIRPYLPAYLGRTGAANTSHGMTCQHLSSLPALGSVPSHTGTTVRDARALP